MRDVQRWQELHGQADAALAKGDYGQAESPGKQAVAAGSAGFGAVDPNVASIWSGLGLAQLRNNNLIEAENSFRQALTIYEQRLGAEHEFTSAMRNNLALVLERKGNFRGAELFCGGRWQSGKKTGPRSSGYRSDVGKFGART